MAEKNGEQRRAKGPTLADVAELAQVSSSAVSRTFSNKSLVSKEVQAKVLKAADKLGYRPNLLASSLMTGRSSLIALATNSFSDPQIMTIIDTFTIELQDRKLRPLIFNLSRLTEWSETVALMSQYRIDGVILASSTLDQDFVLKVVKSGIPTVIAFGRDQNNFGVSASYVDNTEGGRMAASEFLRRDYKRPGFIGARPNVSSTADRLVGFQQRLSLDGSSAHVKFAGEYSYDSGRKAVAELLAEHRDIDAIFCADDLLGMGAIDGIRHDLGRSIPEIGIIGFSDMQISSWPSYELSSFKTDTDRVVHNAIEILQAQIENRSRSVEQRIAACEFIPRKSVRAPSSELQHDPVVSTSF